MTKLWFDLETYSPIPLKNGSHAYAEEAEVLLFAYAIDDEAPQVWRVAEGESMPQDLRVAMWDKSVEWWGHNALMFDWAVLRKTMPRLCELVSIDRRFDTMVQAYSHSLPGSLENLGTAFKVNEDTAKSGTGKNLITLFCKPPAKNVKRERASHKTHPQEWEEFVAYAGQDIVAMRAVHNHIPKWNYPNNKNEVRLSQLDHRINLRGVAVDCELANNAIEAITNEQARLAVETQERTDGAVQAATQRDKMLAHLVAEYGITLPDMRKSTLERRIDDPALPEPLRELLSIRLQASTSSTSKYKKLIDCVSDDQRLRGTLQFCGAQRTGRWAGRLFQPQNLPRPIHDQETIDLGIDAIKNKSVDLLFDDVMAITSSTIRGAIVAPAGRKLVVSDLSNIEGRVLAWLAGEAWKIKAFEDFDAGVGHDLYKLAYAKSFNVTPESVTKDQRQLGKVQELALGYEGGVGAFVTFATAYGMDLDELSERAYPTLPITLRAQAISFLEWSREQKRPSLGLKDQTFIVCDTLKRMWRQAHPQTVRLWHAMSEAVTQAVYHPGTTFTVGKLKVRRDNAWLRIGLPSGRALCYPQPRIDNGQYSYLGLNQYSRRWERINSYSGKIVENITQAVARDVLAYNMPAIEDAGYDIVLTVHDELICETPNTRKYNPDHLARLMSTAPEWAQGLPLAAAGFETTRYRKD